MSPRRALLAAAAGAACFAALPGAAAMPTAVRSEGEAGGLHARYNLTLYIANNATAWKLGGVCLDRTPPGFYFRPGSGDGANKWRVHLRGGGWCTTAEDCYSRTFSDLGSAKYFLPNFNDTPNIAYGFM